MVNPTLTISIDRTSLDKGALVFSAADDGNPNGITAYTPPGRQARIIYAAGSNFVHGATAVGGTWQQAVMSFDTVPDVTTQAALDAFEADLFEAVGQLSYVVTVTVNGSGRDWTCDMGDAVPASREFEDLRDMDPTYTVTIPCYPVAS